MDSHIERLLARARARRRNGRVLVENSSGESLSSRFTFGHAARPDENPFDLRQQEYSFADSQSVEPELEHNFDDAGGQATYILPSPTNITDPNIIHESFPIRRG